MESESHLPNIAMSLTVRSPDNASVPSRTKSVAISAITVDAPRLRRGDDNDQKIIELAENIKQRGLLQPIGVQEKRRKPRQFNNTYRLIYGFRRWSAMQILFEQGEVGADTIPCIVYSPEMSKEAMQLDEIAENLHRKELTAAERAAHTTKYAGLLKKTGAVQSRREKQAQSLTATNTARRESAGKSVKPHHAVKHSPESQKPTVTEKLVSDLGISPDSVQHRVDVAVTLAERQGVKVDGRKTLEALGADTLIAVGEAAAEEAQKKSEKARREGKPENRVDPYHYTKERTNRHYYLNLEELPKSLDGILSKQWERTDSPVTSEILRATCQTVQEWADKWQAREEAK